VISSSEAPSAAVLTITPWPFGRTAFRIDFSRFRACSESRREMPETSWSGARTRKRPGSETWAVNRAPLPPIGSFVTWTITAWPAFRTFSMRGGRPSRSSGE
jgi:hypothetical protein